MATSIQAHGRQTRATGSNPGIRLAALRAPLAAKMIGANALVVAAFLGAWIVVGGPVNTAVVIIVSLVIVLHLALVLVALRPVRDLETVASRVWNGDYGARVERSSVADRGVLRVGSMFNILLDGLVADRARMRTLATEVIDAGERERARIARELHDSTAQHVAALMFQLSSAASEAKDPALAERLHDARDTAQAILEQVRSLSLTVHSAVLDDLGIEAALRKLARDASGGKAIDFDVKVDLAAGRLPRNVRSALYRVAEEAIRNAVAHASPKRLRVVLSELPPSVLLEVHDDGRGFDPEAAERAGGNGLRSMRERIALVDGTLEINTAVGNGTTVCATVPLDPAPADFNSKEIA